MHSRISELTLIPFDSIVFVPFMLRSNLLTTLQTLISNQINISVGNLNGKFIWLQIKNLLKNFAKEKKLSRAVKPKINNFY